ncbi:unnamed protein product, partial [Mesorhabditis belari]|uniref:F-box domain-containing protein n=1 Tax=Mesorhabditis belari TaxID=2138241 RepID=A0AAF3JB82_9BILA
MIQKLLHDFFQWYSKLRRSLNVTEESELFKPEGIFPLESLPNELLVKIFKNITHKDDLQNLCLTSRKLNNLIDEFVEHFVRIKENYLLQIEDEIRFVYTKELSVVSNSKWESLHQLEESLREFLYLANTDWTVINFSKKTIFPKEIVSKLADICRTSRCLFEQVRIDIWSDFQVEDEELNELIWAMKPRTLQVNFHGCSGLIRLPSSTTKFNGTNCYIDFHQNARIRGFRVEHLLNAAQVIEQLQQGSINLEKCQRFHFYTGNTFELPRENEWTISLSNPERKLWKKVNSELEILLSGEI